MWIDFSGDMMWFPTDFGPHLAYSGVSHIKIHQTSGLCALVGSNVRGVIAVEAMTP
jgi:hypothetical protein